MLTLVLLSSTPTLLSSISMLCNKNLPVAPKMPPTRELSCGRGLLKDGSRIATPIIEGSSSAKCGAHQKIAEALFPITE